jgi:hypothetical protein
MATGMGRYEVPKSIAALAFVVFWAIAIVLWCFVGSFSDPATRGFIADIGIVFASVGFAAPFIGSRSGFVRALIFGLISIALFALTGYLGLTGLVYGLRLLVPFFALLMPLNRLLNGIKIFA